MNWRYISHIIGLLTLLLGFAMLFPMGVGLYFGDGSVAAVGKAMAVAVFFGALLFWFSRGSSVEAINQREGMAIVAVAWVGAGVVGALPFYFWGAPAAFVDALFESVSGFTTTGASVLTDIESLPEGLLFWRSLIQWLGGMGIIVLSVAILPFLGVGGMQLYKAETPSPVVDKLRPRIKDTARVLWQVYALISAVQIVLLILGGMGLFDAVCHTFTTMPTGGFSTRNSSIAHYDNLYVDILIIAFMVLAGINFSLHYQFLKGRPLVFWRDSECRFFLGAVLLFTVIVSVDIWGTIYNTIGQALRYGAFQVTSILTTTGYATADYEKWPAFSQLILLFCMFLGASAGSTGGGVKCLRVLLCIKYCYRELFVLIHPRAVTQIKINGVLVSDDIVRSILGFLALYAGLSVISAIVLAGIGVDFTTAIGAVAATMGNIGPGFGMVGPAENYALIPIPGKWLLIWCMLLGRLEIFTMIILLVPEFWRR